MHIWKPDYYDEVHVYFYLIEVGLQKLGCARKADWYSSRVQTNILRELKGFKHPVSLDDFSADEFAMLSYKN
jgi:hypothetical protein